MGLSLLYLPVIVGGLDHRHGWTTPFLVWANVVGLLLCALGYGFAVWALVENRFFTSVVRIQTERGHEVCDSGPYRFVRHPGYAGNLLGVVGIPLALDSLWAFVAAGSRSSSPSSAPRWKTARWWRSYPAIASMRGAYRIACSQASGRRDDSAAPDRARVAGRATVGPHDAVCSENLVRPPLRRLRSASVPTREPRQRRA